MLIQLDTVALLAKGSDVSDSHSFSDLEALREDNCWFNKLKGGKVPQPVQASDMTMLGFSV